MGWWSSRNFSSSEHSEDNGLIQLDIEQTGVWQAKNSDRLILNGCLAQHFLLAPISPQKMHEVRWGILKPACPLKAAELSE